MRKQQNKSIVDEILETQPNIIQLAGSEGQIIYDQKGLDYISNLTFVNNRDLAGNVVINGTVLPLTDEEQAKYNESITIELNDRVYTNNSVNRALDTKFKYFKFPPKLTTRVVPTGSIDIPDIPTEGGLLYIGRVLQVENKLYYLEGSTYYEIAADSPQLGFPQKHLPALTFLAEKLEKPFLFRTKADDKESELFPQFNDFNRNGYADGNNLTYNNQRGELRRRDKYSGIIDLKSKTYLSDPKFEDGGVLGLAELTDNNITDTVVEFNFDLIDEINPAPYEFGLLVDDIGYAWINQENIIFNSGLAAGMQRYPVALFDLNTGLNRIGIWAGNTGGAGVVNYEFKDFNGRAFRHAKGWRAQDAFAGQYGNEYGVKPWQNTPVDEEMTPSRIVTNAYAEDGSYNKVYNTEGKFWLGNNNAGSGLGRLNAEYKWDNRGVRSAAVYNLGVQQDIGWSPKSRSNNRYGIVKVRQPLTVAVETDNNVLPNLNTVNIKVTLRYKSTPTKTIENSERSKSWNGKNQIAIQIPGADVTADLYQINVTQNDVPINDPYLSAANAELAQLKSNLDAAEGRAERAQTLLDQRRIPLNSINRRIEQAQPRTFGFTQAGDPELYNRLIQERVPIQNQFNQANQELQNAQNARNGYASAIAVKKNQYKELINTYLNSGT